MCTYCGISFTKFATSAIYLHGAFMNLVKKAAHVAQSFSFSTRVLLLELLPWPEEIHSSSTPPLSLQLFSVKLHEETNYCNKILHLYRFSFQMDFQLWHKNYYIFNVICSSVLCSSSGYSCHLCSEISSPKEYSFLSSVRTRPMLGSPLHSTPLCLTKQTAQNPPYSRGSPSLMISQRRAPVMWEGLQHPLSAASWYLPKGRKEAQNAVVWWCCSPITENGSLWLFTEQNILKIW